MYLWQCIRKERWLRLQHHTARNIILEIILPTYKSPPQHPTTNWLVNYIHHPLYNICYHWTCCQFYGLLVRGLVALVYFWVDWVLRGDDDMMSSLEIPYNRWSGFCHLFLSLATLLKFSPPLPPLHYPDGEEANPAESHFCNAIESYRCPQFHPLETPEKNSHGSIELLFPCPKSPKSIHHG